MGRLRVRRILGSAVVVAALAICCGGCSRESLRVALAAQQRADAVQQAVVDQQHAALSVLVYRDLCHALTPGSGSLTESEREALNRAWNDRDLIEFWYVQHERARALRLVGVDTKLYGDQSIVDLLMRQAGLRAESLERGLAGLAADGLVGSLSATRVRREPIREGVADEN